MFSLGIPYPFNVNCAEGKESSNFDSESRIMSRVLSMTCRKSSNLFRKELMFKCPTIILLGDFFFFIFFSPILASLNSSGAENNGDFRIVSA